MTQDKPLLIGLTGGIGSGKSTVASMLAKLGASVIDADAISRSLTASCGQAIAAIRDAFGAEFIDSTGALNRQRMRELVFKDPQAKHRLEEIVHPLVSQETQRQAHNAVQAGARCLVFDVPLLVESGRWRRRVDQVLVVDCEPATQIERARNRSALSHDAAQLIVAAQAGRLQRLAAADTVLYNDGISLAELEREVRAVASGFGLSLPHFSDPDTSA